MAALGTGNLLLTAQRTAGPGALQRDDRRSGRKDFHSLVLSSNVESVVIRLVQVNQAVSMHALKSSVVVAALLSSLVTPAPATSHCLKRSFVVDCAHDSFSSISRAGFES